MKEPDASKRRKGTEWLEKLALVGTIGASSCFVQSITQQGGRDGDAVQVQTSYMPIADMHDVQPADPRWEIFKAPDGLVKAADGSQHIDIDLSPELPGGRYIRQIDITKGGTFQFLITDTEGESWKTDPVQLFPASKSENPILIRLNIHDAPLRETHIDLNAQSPHDMNVQVEVLHGDNVKIHPSVQGGVQPIKPLLMPLQEPGGPLVRNGKPSSGRHV